MYRDIAVAIPYLMQEGLGIGALLEDYDEDYRDDVREGVGDYLLQQHLDNEAINLILDDDEVYTDFFDDWDDDTIIRKAISFNNLKLDGISQRPPRKAGYKPTLVVRKGKKKWINKRQEGKKVILTAKQRQALAKARRKAHTAKAKMHREKSNRIAQRI